jgi:hypothetical protein
VARSSTSEPPQEQAKRQAAAEEDVMNGWANESRRPPQHCVPKLVTRRSEECDWRTRTGREREWEFKSHGAADVTVEKVVETMLLRGPANKSRQSR